jgi:tRNA-modifying protein YgfZ
MITGRDNRRMQDATKSLFNFSTPLNLPGGPIGVIRAQGADTVKFLQGQLTQDVALLGLDQARLAAWCSAKGRMLASFIVLKQAPDDILLLCHPSVLATTLKRLQMFVMRAQCKLSDATAQFEVLGLAGDTIKLIAASAVDTWTIGRNGTENGLEMQIQLPAGTHDGAAVARALVIRPLANANTDSNAASVTATAPGVVTDAALEKSVTTTLDAAASPAASLTATAKAEALAVWAYLEASTGIAPITAPVVEAYVPQMLNYESVGGVNFKKGCYPGQEVVARSQFRGTLKRRAYVVRCDAPMAAGQEVFDAEDSEQPCGSVAFAAAVPLSTQWLGIVSMQTSSAGSTLNLGAGSGPALQLQALPYALLDDI